ncbi:MAG: NAD(P)H-dependent oxidoreductase [Candidatus Limnocylindria bacterium]
MILDKALMERERGGRPVRVGLVGAGFMGRSMTRAMLQYMHGMDVVAIANRTIERAEAAYRGAGVGTVRRVTDPEGLGEAIARGERAVTSDPLLLCAADGIDVIVEATGELEHGAAVAVAAIDAKKHLVLVNAELDATVGPLLKVRADEAAVVITNADGDEPGVAMNIVRFVEMVGVRPVMAGNVKGFLDQHRTPDTQEAFSRKWGLTTKMATSFADGTKQAMECTVLSNATGFGVARRGMSGHSVSHVKDVLSVCDLDALLEQPVVEYLLGAEPGSGAFCVGYDPDPDRARYMSYFKMGDGPLYVFYRPFHLTHLEAPLSAARAVLFDDATIAPRGAPQSEVLVMAKRDLRVGDVLDGVGGYASYGVIESSRASRGADLLPMGLSEGCTVVRTVAKDDPVSFADVEVPGHRLIDRLWREQADHFADEPPPSAGSV